LFISFQACSVIAGMVALSSTIGSSAEHGVPIASANSVMNNCRVKFFPDFMVFLYLGETAGLVRKYRRDNCHIFFTLCKKSDDEILTAAGKVAVAGSQCWAERITVFPQRNIRWNALRTSTLQNRYSFLNARRGGF